MMLDYDTMMKLINGARTVNRHDVAVALQAILIRCRIENALGDEFDAACVVEVISDAAIRSVTNPRVVGAHSPQITIGAGG